MFFFSLFGGRRHTDTSFSLFSKKKKTDTIERNINFRLYAEQLQSKILLWRYGFSRQSYLRKKNGNTNRHVICIQESCQPVKQSDSCRLRAVYSEYF